MTNKSLLRGALPSPRHKLAGATPHYSLTAPPPQFIVIPKKLSMWGNDKLGDCVTAEEAFAKAANDPEIVISTAEVVAWAEAHGYANGATLTDVMDSMQTKGFPALVHLFKRYDDGPYKSVDWTNPGVLQSAISIGPVKIGIAADQVQTAYTAGAGKNGWLGIGFTPEKPDAEDHCVSLCGYGSLSWLASQLGVTLPATVDGSKLGYALFTWSTIGIVDELSMLNITFEAWLRNPTTVVK